MKYAILAVMFLAAVCFGQVDSADQELVMTAKQHLKLIDTSISFREFHRNFYVDRGEVMKIQLRGSAIDSIGNNYIERKFDAKKKPMANGDTLIIERFYMDIVARVISIEARMKNAGAISPPRDTTIILNSNNPVIR